MPAENYALPVPVMTLPVVIPVPPIPAMVGEVLVPVDVVDVDSDTPVVAAANPGTHSRGVTADTDL